jgi:chromosome segregation ATPase
MDLSDLFLEVLAKAKEPRGEDGDSAAVCLPSARSYKDVLNDNLRLHSMVLNLKVEIEKLNFMNSKLTEEVSNLRARISTKKTKYKSELADKESIIGELHTRLESVTNSYRAQQDCDQISTSETIKQLEFKLVALQKQRDLDSTDLSAVRSDLSQTKESLLSNQEKLKASLEEISSLRGRLSTFGIPAPPQSTLTPQEPPPVLLLSKFYQRLNT